VAQGKAPAAHKGMIHAAKIMAATARVLIEDAALLQAAQAAHARHLAERPYECPIPPEISPPVVACA
jgi:aminobenzoyl-glutamate utilization protein B